MIIFGGANTSGALNDVWVLANANGLGGTPTWTQLLPTGGPPSPRTALSAIYDPLANTMTIFAGYGPSYSNDVWVLANANGLGGTPTWTQQQPTGGPPVPRYLHSAVFNSSTDRMTVFGGIDSTGYGRNDTWVLVPSTEPLSMGLQAMEGNLTLSAGDALQAGYDFTMPGSHPTATVSFIGSKVTFAWRYISVPGSGVLVVPMANQSYMDAQGSPNWYPSGDQQSSLVYQGSIAVPDVCGGGAVNFGEGGTFSTGISSTDTKNKVNVRWHYSGGGSAGGWSGTQSVVP